MNRAVVLAAPPLFLLHEAEEYRTMLPWVGAHSSIVPDVVERLIPATPAFIAYAGVIFLIVYAIAAIVALRSPPHATAWIVFAILLAARLENAIIHIFETLILRQYTPGVLTAALIVLPVTLYLLWQLVRENIIRTRWLPAIICGGFAAHAIAIAAMLTVAG